MKFGSATLLLGTIFLVTALPAGAQRPRGFIQVAVGSTRARGHDVTFGTSSATGAFGVPVGQHEWIEFRLSRLSADYIDYVAGFGDEGYNAYGATAYPLDILMLNERPAVAAGLRPFLGVGLSLIPLQDRANQCCGVAISETIATGALFAGGVRRTISGGLEAELRGGYRLMLDLARRPGWPVDFTGLALEFGARWRW